MQKTISVHELRAGAGRILRRVHDKHETADVTYHGQVIARIVPVVQSAEVAPTVNAVWTDINQLAGEIGRQRGPEGESAAGAVSVGRRG